MDGRIFDELTRAATDAGSRRGALRLMAGAALTAAIAKISPVAAKKKGKGKNKKKKCKKLNQGCGGKKKCCNGLTCADGTCLKPAAPECDSDNDCGANEICQNGVCVPEPPECEDDNDCDSDEICQDGACVPEPECDSDSDCGDNETCDDGFCICPAVVEDRCIIDCVGSGDCPSGCDCRRLFPDGEPRACVDDSALCDANSCDNSDDCFGDELCVQVGCDNPNKGRCFPICVRGED